MIGTEVPARNSALRFSLPRTQTTMVSSSFATYFPSPLHRLTSLASHLNSTPAQRNFRVVVSRDLGPEAMPLLTSREDIDVITLPEFLSLCILFLLAHRMARRQNLRSKMASR